LENQKGRDRLGGLGRNGKFNWVLRKWQDVEWIQDSGWGRLTISCDYSTEVSGFIKGGELLQ
jgi:hypothetical protein